MTTVTREIAEGEIARFEKQKRPKAYCIVRYQNRRNGDSEQMTYSGYAICHTPAHYHALMENDNVGGVDILWSSARCKADLAQQDANELWRDAIGVACTGLGK